MGGKEEEEERFISLAKCVSQLNVLLGDRFYECIVAVRSARAGEVLGLLENGTDAPWNPK